ncbi:MAG: ATP-binding protein [Bdellovibrionales bacterium]
MSESSKRSKIMTSLLRLSFALGITIALNQFPLHYLEFLGFDALARVNADSKTSDNITMVSIGRKTLEKIGRAPNLREHTEFLEIIAENEPKAVFYLLDTETFRGSPEDLKMAALAIKKIPNFIINVNDLPSPGSEHKFHLPGPLSFVQMEPGILSKDRKNFALDDVSRRLIMSYDNVLFAQTKLAQLVTGPKDVDKYQGAFEFKGSHQTLVNIHRAGSFNRLSFIDTLTDDFSKKDFKDKIVIVGNDLDAEADYFLQTALSRDVVAMSKLEYNANIIETLIVDSGIRQIPAGLKFALTFLIAALTTFVTFRMRPGRGIIVILGTSAGLFFASLALYNVQLWIPLAHPFIAIFICYYLLIPYRLIQENKKSWEFQQKNELLTQVEELKNNFISMMSHDLKTPLARIQGMAEMALVEKERLNTDQQEALGSISTSAEELSLFVSSVLNFGRIEAKGVNLNLESKDINKIIDEVVKRYKYLARKKNIELVVELEPLFSTPMDVDLMRQVVQNLIENAIKYSPENTKVLISTEEIDGMVQLQVSDQGRGISEDELDKVFMKFYRSKDAKSSPIKGTGLGLYLTKYFVDLHSGEIQVDSMPGKGSTFTVNLPTDVEV